MNPACFIPRRRTQETPTRRAARAALCIGMLVCTARCHGDSDRARTASGLASAGPGDADSLDGGLRLRPQRAARPSAVGDASDVAHAGDAADAGTDACTACLEDQCRPQLVSCVDTTGCQNLAICLDDCGGDAGCTQSCLENYHDGTDALQAVIDCRDGTCTQPCATQ